MPAKTFLIPRAVVLALLVLVPLAACGRALPAPTELQGDFRVHDPSMIKQGNSYYVFSTGDEHYNQGNIQIRTSADLVSWKLVGSVFAAKPEWIAAKIGSMPPNLWAPDVSYLNGKYYLYYAGSLFGTNKSVIGLATNTTLDPQSPDYNWVDEGLVINSLPSFSWNAIDPNLSLDKDGAPWLSLGSFWNGIKLQRLDPATGKLSSSDTTLYSLASRGGGPIEAPAIVYRDNWYYLFVSFDICCRGAQSTYKIMVGRSDKITGPYTDKSGKPMMEGGGTLVLETADRYHGPGGQAVYVDNGTYRLVHHYYDALDRGVPKLRIHDLQWAPDGWPIVAGP